jgi:cysteinyl-tRNA synthetase
MNLVLHDTPAGAARPLETRDPGHVSMYVCGPTVYDVPHVGHGRFALVFDVLRRYLTWDGVTVNYVSNITDVDDKIIGRACQEGRSEAAVAAEFEAVWFETMNRLGVLRPTHVPHATEYIPRMIEMVAQLAASGMAYETADGVYLAVDQVPDYGYLTRQPLCELRAGARVAVDEAKRSPLDFALWKKTPAADGAAWGSPWGFGRPGWHTECVVMSLDLLGDGFDLHGGGQDLRFPHHENERAQAAALGRKFANHWMHNAFIEVGDKKMGKSEGNARPLGQLLDEHDPRSYRLLVLQSHYRSPLQVTPDTMAEADRSLARLDGYLRRSADLPVADPGSDVIGQIRARMNDDLDTAGAMAIVFNAIRKVNACVDKNEVSEAAPTHAAVADVLTAFGLVGGRTPMAPRVPPEVAMLLDERRVARAERNWANADELRSRIESLGWSVIDTAMGQVSEPTARR